MSGLAEPYQLLRGLLKALKALLPEVSMSGLGGLWLLLRVLFLVVQVMTS